MQQNSNLTLYDVLVMLKWLSIEAYAGGAKRNFKEQGSEGSTKAPWA